MPGMGGRGHRPGCHQRRHSARGLCMARGRVLVRRHLSEYASERPGPDLPDLLAEADSALGERPGAGCNCRNRARPGRPAAPARGSTDDLDLAELVAAIPNSAGWDGWNAMGLGSTPPPTARSRRVVFDDWSAKSPSTTYITADRWRHYHRSPPSHRHGKLVKLARPAGAGRRGCRMSRWNDSSAARRRTGGRRGHSARQQNRRRP